MSLQQKLPVIHLPQRIPIPGTPEYGMDMYDWAGDTPFVREQIDVEWNDTSFVLRTLSPDHHLACRTELIPVHAHVSIQPNLTNPMVLSTKNKAKTAFPPDVRAWISTALDYTTHLVNRVQRGEQPELPLLEMQSCYGIEANALASMIYNDS